MSEKKSGKTAPLKNLAEIRVTKASKRWDIKDSKVVVMPISVKKTSGYN